VLATGHTGAVPNPSARQPIKLRSPFTRAVVPVVAGIFGLAAIGLFTWGIAAYISRGGAETSDRLAPTTLEVGSVQNVADIVEEDGPVLFPGLNTTTGARTIVLDHEGDDPTRGWRIYYAYPADQDADCAVEQVVGTRSFIDCNGNTIDVADLSPPPPGVNPIVEDQRKLIISLVGVTGEN